MKFKIHYTIQGVEDEIIVTGDTIEDIKKRADEEMTRRGVDQSTRWSEEL